MLRDKNLVPLSHQHQHALALCVRLDRALQADDVDIEAWQAELETIFANEIRIHFAAEESVVFPAARRSSELSHIVEELLMEHAVLRELFRRAGSRELQKGDLPTVIERLATHIRKEERLLFEGMQTLMSAEEFSALGSALDRALKDSSTACLLPSNATRLRPKQ
jgi:hemerythrin-like domain-containing protein